MNESLTCTSCSKVWKRQRTRGRKPLLCPECTKEQNKEIVPTTKTKKAVKSPTIKPLKAKPINPVQTHTDLTINKVINSLPYANVKSAQLAESTKNGSLWKCPGCGNTIELFVSINAVPTHRCTPDMVSVKLMERIK